MSQDTRVTWWARQRRLFSENPNFRRLWLAQAVSMLGNRMATVALAIYATTLTGSSALVGVVLAAQTVPLVLVLLLGGVIGDRYPRQRVMLISDLGQMIAFGMLATLILLHAASVAWLIAIALISGGCEGFFRPASTALLPQTVAQDLLGDAVAARELPLNLSWIVGPALAGVLIAAGGAGWPFALNAISFAFSAVMLARIRVAGPSRANSGRGLIAEVARGFAELRARRWLWTQMTAHSMVLFAGVAPYEAVGPTLARTHFGAAARFGFVTTALGAGLVAGSLLALRLRPHRLLLSNLLGLSVWPVFLLALASGASFVVVVLVALLNGTATGLSNCWWETVLVKFIPNEVLAQISSFDWLITYALQPCGLVGFGAIARFAGATEAMLAAACVVATALTLALLRQLAPSAEGNPVMERVGG